MGRYVSGAHREQHIVAFCYTSCQGNGRVLLAVASNCRFNQHIRNPLMSRLKRTNRTQPAKALRERAEEMAQMSRTDIADLKADDVQSLVDELQIHQMELLTQNAELQDAQRQLLESRDRYADLYEFAPVGYFTLDQQGNILEANLTACAMLGVDRQVLLRSRLTQFVEHEYQDAFHVHRQLVFSSNTKQACELRMKRASQPPLSARIESVAFGVGMERRCRSCLIDLAAEQPMWIQLQESQRRYHRSVDSATECVNPAQVEGGRIVESIDGSQCMDITERNRVERELKASEERMRAILRTAADAIITIDQTGTIVEANLATEKMFGWSQSELIGHNVKILMPQPYASNHDGYLARYQQTGKAGIIGIGREIVGLRKDGSIFPIWLAVSQVDHLKLFTGIIRDLSKIKELERHLLEIASDEQRRIGQELHDGTGQELTGLSLYAGTVVDALNSATKDEVDGTQIWILNDPSFQRIRKSAKSLLDGLTLANQHVHELSHGIMPVQINAEGLRSSLSELATATNAHDKIDCSFEYVGNVTVPDNSTATHLYRIAQEALSNALRHGRANQIRIQLSQENGLLHLSVCDNGVGFDPNAKSREGQGMGLRIMAYRASVIGGVFRIERMPEGGMQVTCTIHATENRT
jgi:PAS domain S-box-containing protein